MKKLFTIRNVIPVFILGFVLQSCIPVRNLKPLIEEGGVVLNEEGYIEINKPTYRVRTGDELKIKILTEDTNLAKYLGTEFVDRGSDTGSSGTDNFSGRTVDKEGYIQIPKLGKLYVQGKTFDEIKLLVEDSLKKLYKGDINIKVGLTAYEFYITGEVSGPRKYSTYRQVNLMEAITMSGSLPITADMSKIRIFKKMDNGYRLVIVDLNQMSTMNAEEFYVDHNDIIQIDPIKTKTLGTGTNALSTTLTITSFITSMVGFYFFIKNL
ncbi:MAG: polysaccharide biosynthesis/export family protein [Flavobacteriales bacterium]